MFLKERRIFKGLSKIRNMFSMKKKTVFKQELLLRKALREKGFNDKSFDIMVNHDLGENKVNDEVFGIKYPDSFFEKSVVSIPENKKYKFYFNGNMNISGKREILLKPFYNFHKSKIINSNDGRVEQNKDKFNEDYFSGLANSFFSLCPHQVDWPGSKTHLWTYRFIESCMVKSIPVLFKEAPLSANFTKDFYYIWDKKLLESNGNIDYREEWAELNLSLAKERFFLNDVDCEKLRKFIKIKK